MKVSSVPFAVAREAVSASAWSVAAADGMDTPLTAQLEHWDPALRVRVHNEVRVDREQLRAETGLCRTARVRLCAGWYCHGTRTRELVFRHEFDLSSGSEVKLAPAIVLPGSSLARRVTLENYLVVVAAGIDGVLTAARLPGSVIWAFNQDLVLESQHSRFPVEWADFETSVYGNSAAWALAWDPQDLDCSTLGGVTLLLNQAHPVTAPLLREEPPSETSRILWETIHFDVARQLIEGALANDEFVEHAEAYDDGTLGATIRRMISVHLPHYEIGNLRALRSSSPTQFQTLLQTSLRIFRER